MIYPNKNIKVQDSILYKMTHLLEDFEVVEIGILELYNRTKSKFNNIDEYIYSLDVLYILEIIDVDFELEKITYVKRN